MNTANNATIILHQWEVSPFCAKVRGMLEHKKLNYTVVNYNGLRSVKAQKLSSVGKLPVIDIGEKRIQDSTRIARFLDAYHPENPLYPTDPHQNVQVELWEDWADEALYFYDMYFRVMDSAALDQFVRLISEGRPTFEKKSMKLTFWVAGRVALKAQGLGRMHPTDVENEFKRHLDRLEIALAPSGWLVGKTRTLADIAVGSQLNEVQRTSPQHMELERRPILSRWLERIVDK